MADVAASAMRADKLLVARGLAPTRSAAQRVIQHGGVRWRAAHTGDAKTWTSLHKAGEELPDDCALEILDDAELRWVSRGGLKLAPALAQAGVDVAGKRGLDLGQGTGGFTDVLLAHGAAQVVGIDVGHGQLHAKLAADRRVLCFEGVNVRALADVDALTADLAAALGTGFDIVVADLSFISLAHALPAVVRWLRGGGDALLLVKPQFELQPTDIGKGGLVRAADARERIEARLRAQCARTGLAPIGWFGSSIVGGDGNREWFLHARRAPGGATA
ncbi:MAG TPA: TlyA family RNA methyltransferase [Caldimonas sp.]|nr:TlyA family RNA methyltransferase [Caldimonas sp.]